MEGYTMGTLNDIRQKLLSGYSTSQLIAEGYAKSSVNHVARKLKKNQEPSTTAIQVDDELQGLRHQKEKIKLQKEIAELEAGKEKLPDRVAALETKLAQLEGSVFKNRVEDAMCALFESVICAACGQTGWVILTGVCAYCGKPIQLAIGVTEDRMAQVRAGRPVRKQGT